MAGDTPWTVTEADDAAANTLFDELDAAGWPKVGAYKLFKNTLAQHRHESQVELVEALIAAKREMWQAARGQWTLADFKNWAIIQQIDAALENADGKPRTAAKIGGQP